MRNSWKKSGRGGLALLLSAALLGAGCATTPVQLGEVTHIVLLWMKRPQSAGDRAQLIRAAQSLRYMPGIVRVETGRVLPTMNEAVDRSFDLGVVMTFRDRAALARYEKDPRHETAMKRYLRPLVRHYEVYNLGGR